MQHFLVLPSNALSDVASVICNLFPLCTEIREHTLFWKGYRESEVVESPRPQGQARILELKWCAVCLEGGGRGEDGSQEGHRGLRAACHHL